MSFKRFKSQLNELLIEYSDHSNSISPENSIPILAGSKQSHKSKGLSKTQKSKLTIKNYLRESMYVTYQSREIPVYLVNDDQAQDCSLTILKEEVKKHKVLYIDLEFEHKQGVKGAVPALMQISAGQSIYVVDLLECELSEAWKEFLSDQSYTWVLHDAREDIKILVSRYLIKPPRKLFDTQVAWGFYSIESTIGLAALSYSMYQIQPNKSLQVGRFLNRPLAEDLLRYAAEDIPPLISLFHTFNHSLDCDRIAGVYEESKHRIARSEDLYLRLISPSDDPELVKKESKDPLLKFRKKLWMLTPQQTACLRLFLTWRPELSSQRSPVSWPKAKLLFNLAQMLPADQGDLAKIQGLDPRFIQQYGMELIRMSNEVRATVPEQWSDDNKSPWTKAERPSFSGEGTLETVAQQRIYYHWSFLIITSLSAQTNIAPEYICAEAKLKTLSQTSHSASDMIDGLKIICSETWRIRVLMPILSDLLKHYHLI